jgi:phosphoenolpyruvate carboxykinase (ATP)
LAAERGIDAVFARGEGVLPAVARLGGERYLLKAGRVGGPEDQRGSMGIGEQFVAKVLDEALAGTVSWETDPDFGYEVAASVPGVQSPEDGLLMPRLLYTRADRVYEHAAIVPRVRAEISALIAS